MKIAARLASLILLFGMAAAITSAQTPVSHAEMDSTIKTMVGDPLQFQQVMTTLQQVVARHDAAAVAALVSYPITVNPNKKTAMRVRTPEAFVARYDKIITPYIANVIKNQKYEELFVNYQGAMFGSGEIWIAGICKDKECKQSDPKIKTIQNTDGRSH